MIVFDGNVTFSEYFSPLLQDDVKGEILLVTSKGIYFRLSDRIFQLTDASLGVTPIGIGIDYVGFSTPLGLKEGQPIHLKNGELHLPSALVKIKTVKTDTQCPLSPLMPDLIRKCAKMLQVKCKPRGISSLCAPLLNAEEKFDMSVSPLCQIAYPLLSELIQAMQDGSKESITASVKGLIGMGIGLTPSSDDVLLGMVYGLLRFAPDATSTGMLAEAVINCAPVNTNAISAAYLLAVANGAPFGRLDDVLCGLAGQIPLDIEPILEIGSSSGSEMLLGLLLAAKIIYL